MSHSFGPARGFLIAALLLAALPVGARAAEQVFQRGLQSDPETIDPHKFTQSSESWLIYDLFIGLTTIDAHGRTAPGAATHWEASSDGKQYTFHLREGMTWSDGAPLDAEDFVYSFRRILDPKTAVAWAHMLYVIENAAAVNRGELPLDRIGVSAPDARTVVFKLVHPVPYFPDLIKDRGFPAPRHRIEVRGDAWATDLPLVSNGAFVLMKREPNTPIELVRNPKFFEADTVRLEKVIHVPNSDGELGVKQYRAGAKNLITIVPPRQAEWAEKNAPKDYIAYPTNGVVYISLNVQKPPMSDLRVRRALSLAIDRALIAERILRGGEKPAYSVIPQSLRPSDAVEAAYKLPMAQRQKMARELLAEAGYGASQPLQVELKLSPFGLVRPVMTVVASMWKEVGVDVQIHNQEARSHFTELGQGNFMAGAAFSAFSIADPIFYLSPFETAAINQNFGRFNDPVYDGLLQKIRETANADERRALVQKADDLASAALPVIPIHYYVQRELLGSRVRGWEGNAPALHLSRYVWIADEDR